jgi:hypothetical protein
VSRTCRLGVDVKGFRPDVGYCKLDGGEQNLCTSRETEARGAYVVRSGTMPCTPHFVFVLRSTRQRGASHIWL